MITDLIIVQGSRDKSEHDQGIKRKQSQGGGVGEIEDLCTNRNIMLGVVVLK